MPAIFNTQVGSLISNSNPYPDGAIQVPFVSTIAAAGTTQSTATPILAEVNLINNNTAANGFILPVGLLGQRVVVYPQLVTAACLGYPPVGGTINNGTVNAGAATVARIMKTFVCVSGNGLTWVSAA
jgi:hypothetical protein